MSFDSCLMGAVISVPDTMQPPGAIDVSAFYVMHDIIEAKKHKQVLIIPTHKTILSTLNNALHVILIQHCLLPVYVAIGYKEADPRQHNDSSRMFG
jgi:hypothetical protein